MFWLYLYLQIIGSAALLPLVPRIPLWFALLSGFVWGLLIWLGLSWVALLLPWHAAALWTGAALVPLLLAALLLRSGSLPLLRRHALPIGGFLLLYSVLVGLITASRAVNLTPDSMFMDYLGRGLARDGLTPWAIDQFTDWGLLLPLLLMSGQLLFAETLVGFPVLLMAALLLTAAAGLYCELRTHQLTAPHAALITAVGLLLLYSPAFAFHTFYIHTNIIAAACLFVGLYALSCFVATRAAAWLVPGVIALSGFSFTRIEGALYTVPLLVLLLSLVPLRHRVRLIVVLPYTSAAGLWYGFLFVNVNQTGLLGRGNIAIVLLLLLAFVGFGLLMYLPAIDRLVRHVAPLLPLLLLLALAAALLLRPAHMLLSTSSVLENLFNITFWGWSWYLVSALLLLLWHALRVEPQQRLLLYGALTYSLLVVLLGVARHPYRTGETDSANRLLFQILPVFFLLIAGRVHLLLARFRRRDEASAAPADA